MNEHRRQWPGMRRSQRGVVLVVCLVFLVVVTLIATGSMETTIVEERMAGNMQDYGVAFQAAEVALAQGEEWLADQVLLPSVSSNGTTVAWVGDAPDPDSTDNLPWWQSREAAWWNANAQQVAGMTGVATQPQYIIEQVFEGTQGQSLALGTGEADTRTSVFHRITARGVGGSANTEVLLQTTYVREYD